MFAYFSYLCFFSPAKRVESSADLSTLEVKDHHDTGSGPSTPKPADRSLNNNHSVSSDNLAAAIAAGGGDTPETALSKFKNKNPDFSATKQYKLQLSQGISKFNSSSKKGMRFLIEHGFVENTPEAVATFLRSVESLDKTAIGEYLGEA